jgi:spermidine synthase
MRGFSIILGSTIYAMACVVTVFMLGLAAGSLFISRVLRSDGWPTQSPLLAYGTVELLVGLSSLLITWTLFTHQSLYLSLSGSPTAPWPQRLGAQFTVCLGLIGVPTALMGVTLPLLSQLVAEPRQVSALYGVNTIGAATGSILSSFVFIYYLGCVRGGAAAAAINVLIFVVALSSDRFFSSAERTGAARAFSRASAGSEDRMLNRWLMLALAVFSGFVVLSCEIVWTRFLSTLRASRSASFSSAWARRHG